MLSCIWTARDGGRLRSNTVPKGPGSSCQKGQFSAWLHSGGLLVTSEHRRRRGLEIDAAPPPVSQLLSYYRQGS